jgi:Uma2 family endonuclease
MSQRVVDQLYTAEEFERMPQFHQRYELIEGKLVEKPMPKYEHSDIIWSIQRAYFLFDPKEQSGVIRPEVTFRAVDDSRPCPDLSYWTNTRKPNRKVEVAPYPDLAIEVQSPGQLLKDLQKKAEIYLKSGVRLVWIIRPEKKVALVYHSDQPKFLTVSENGVLEGGEVIPGFSISLSELFKG